MWKQTIVRSIAVGLIFVLPLPVFAEVREGLRLPAQTFQAPSRSPTSTTDRDKDSLKEGAIIGAIIGAAWCLYICGQGLESTSQIPLAVAAGAGMGALLGAGIDSGFSRSPRVQFRWRF